jgi:hypothetical protein
MSDHDSEAGFLGRWAKRKAQARTQEHIEELAPQGELASQKETDDEAEPFDLASLPSLDDITGETDVTAFLRREVPDWLRNAALKRAWAADPGIRDYVNPAMEYAFDWNVPGGVPGSGELEAGYDAASQVAQMFSTPLKPKSEEVEEEAHTLVAGGSTEGGAEGAPDAAPAQEAPTDSVRLSLSGDVDKIEEDQSSSSEPSNRSRVAETSGPQPASAIRRRHGGATPS